MMHALLWPFINVSILVGVLVYFLREPLKIFVSSRSRTISDELLETEKFLGDTRKKHDEIRQKLSALSAEIASIHAEAKKEAELSGARLIENAKTLASRIRKEADLSKESTIVEFKKILVSDYGLKIIQLVEKTLREKMTSDQKANLRKKLSIALESQS